MFCNPTQEAVQIAFEEIVATPESEDGYTSISLESEDGWCLSSYGPELLILDHKDRMNHLPVHLEGSSNTDALCVLVAFSRGEDIHQLDWQLGYGPG